MKLPEKIPFPCSLNQMCLAIKIQLLEKNCLYRNRKKPGNCENIDHYFYKSCFWLQLYNKKIFQLPDIQKVRGKKGQPHHYIVVWKVSLKITKYYCTKNADCCCELLLF